MDDLCISEDVDQRKVSLRLTVLVFFHSLSIRQVSRRMVILRRHKSNDKLPRLTDQPSNPGKRLDRVRWFMDELFAKKLFIRVCCLF